MVVVVVVDVVVVDANLQTECVCPHTLSMKLCRSPRARTRASARGLRKLALNYGKTWRSAKNEENPLKTRHRCHNTAESRVPVSVAQLESPPISR